MIRALRRWRRCFPYKRIPWHLVPGWALTAFAFAVTLSVGALRADDSGEVALWRARVVEAERKARDSEMERNQIEKDYLNCLNNGHVGWIDYRLPSGQVIREYTKCSTTRHVYN